MSIINFLANFRSFHGVIIASLSTLVIIVGGAVGFYLIEGWDFFDALYMTVITVSTVGYGEVRPLSPLGRIFAITLILIGSLVVGSFFAFTTTYFLEMNLSGNWFRRKMNRNIDRLYNHIIICGIGSVGEQVIAKFCQSHLNNFVVIEQRDEQLSALFEKWEGFKYFIQGDATDEDVLKRAGIERAKAIVTTLPTDASNLFVVVTAKILNPKVLIISRCLDQSAISKLRRAGADHVISPNIISGERMASVVLKPNIVSFLDNITLGEEQVSLSMEEVPISSFSHLVNKSLHEAQIPQKTGLMVIAIRSGQTNKFMFNPRSATILQADDVLIVLGSEHQVKSLILYVARRMKN